MNLDAWKILMEGVEPDGTDCLTVSHEYGHGNAIEFETAIFLYALVRRFKPRNILETGTHYGYSSAALALGLQDNHRPYPQKAHGGIVTIDVNSYEGKPEHLWERLGLNFIFHKIASSEDPRTYDSISPDGVIDMFYMDADHSAEAIVREMEGAYRLLNKQRCLLVFHDTRLDDRMDAGISAIIQILDTLRKNGKGWENINHFPMRNLRGLDMILLSNGDYGV